MDGGSYGISMVVGSTEAVLNVLGAGVEFVGAACVCPLGVPEVIE